MADELGPIFDALADGNRRRVVGLLAEQESATATELAAELPVTRQAVAKHLAALTSAGLVQGRKSGREVRYELTPQALDEAVSWIQAVGERWDERLVRLRTHVESSRSRGR